MSVPVISNAFVGGELAPSLYGRTDLPHYGISASTFRNGFVNYRGGFYSRAGTAFCGFSKQTGRGYPPRLITFQFSIDQGLALEFGNHYMRVLYDGAFVTEPAVAITGVSEATPAVVSAAATGATAATVASNSAVTQSYAPGDDVTIAGGTFLEPAVLDVTSTTLLSIGSDLGATSGVYAPGDTVTLAGGISSPAAVFTVSTTRVVAATVAAIGHGGTDSPNQIVVGTTGTGTKFSASVVIAGNFLFSVNSIVIEGDYTANPSIPSNEPVIGGGLVGAALNLTMGILAGTVTTAGAFTENPEGGFMTQASTSGSGLGATFGDAIFGVHAVSVAEPGNYSAAPSNPASQSATTGSGLGATFDLTIGAVDAFNDGDWVYISGLVGPTQLNGETFVVGASTTSGFELFDVYGNAVANATAYVSGGTAARVYTLTTPWAEADLPWLKFIESTDEMTFCCVNQSTQTEYPAQNLVRFADDDWALESVTPQPSIEAPTGLEGSPSTTGSTYYAYCVTALAADGSESTASEIVYVNAAVDITATAGTIAITWNALPQNYGFYVYKAEPNYSMQVPPGSLFGFAGQAAGNQFTDSNIVADVSQVPPTHQNPFANGQIVSVNATANGTGYTTAELQITTSTGSGFSAYSVIVNSGVVAWVVTDAGQNYAPTDTGTVTGDGSGATVALDVGPQSGNRPGTPSYFQQRRAFAYSLNDPDTYWMSQPGAYANFDTRDPTIDTDAITGSPWAEQVNGIQFMLQTAGGLLVFTGLSVWLLVGAGSFATNVEPISPTSQDALPQVAFGCSATVPPIKIGLDALYVNSKNSFVYDQPYQLYTLSEPIDLTESSSHLFVGYTILEWAWCEQPYKLVWAVRSDGALLSLTWYKSQQVAGWARHDTKGLFKSVCSVIEPPVDAPYLATQRFIGGNDAYMIERMDNRIWNGVEDVWAVDCGVALPQPQPAAQLTASTATGLGSVTGGTVSAAGSGYSSATVWSVVDAPTVPPGYQGPTPSPGPGTGAVPTVTLNGSGGVASVTFSGGSQGSGYLNPQLVGADPVNSSGSLTAPQVALTLDNSATFTATAAVFSSGDVGSVIRMGGGIAEITAFIDDQHVVADILSPIVGLIPGTTSAPAGAWTMTAPVTTVGGLSHLIGERVTGLADGNVIPPQTVSASGTITLGTAASSIVAGLGFTPQLQGVRIDVGNPTVQGQRKKIAAVTVRMEASRGLQVGTNQPDGAALSPPQLAPTWADLAVVPDNGWKPYNALAQPLFTGDARATTAGGFATPGQVAVQQPYPLPMQVLALIPEVDPGDVPQTKAPPLPATSPRAAPQPASGRPPFLPASQ